VNKAREQPIIIVRKKVQGHGHHGGAWKVAFADFMTAMFALFLVLWLVNQSSDVKAAIAGYFADPLGRADVSIEAVACDAANAAVLHLQPGEPVLHVRRLTWSASGRPVDYEHLYCRGDAWQYRVQLNRRST